MYIYIYVYIYIYICIYMLKSFQVLPLSVYLHKTATIPKYLQFSIYKLNKNAVGIR